MKLEILVSSNRMLLQLPPGVMGNCSYLASSSLGLVLSRTSSSEIPQCTYEYSQYRSTSHNIVSEVEPISAATVYQLTPAPWNRDKAVLLLWSPHIKGALGNVQFTGSTVALAGPLSPWHERRKKHQPDMRAASSQVLARLRSLQQLIHNPSTVSQILDVSWRCQLGQGIASADWLERLDDFPEEIPELVCAI
jgi:hypothetical protein